jgi:hypothetical protein
MLPIHLEQNRRIKMKNPTLPPSMTLVIVAILATLLLAACASGDDGIEDGVLRLTFDGESCTYEGPTTLKAGPATLHFYNNSEVVAAVNLVRHTGDETIQDVIDYIGEEPTNKKDAPVWTTSVIGVWGDTQDGETRTWEGELEPGLHHMVCFSLYPYGGWFGTGLMVED